MKVAVHDHYLIPDETTGSDGDAVGGNYGDIVRKGAAVSDANFSLGTSGLQCDGAVSVEWGSLVAKGCAFADADGTLCSQADRHSDFDRLGKLE